MRQAQGCGRDVRGPRQTQLFLQQRGMEFQMTRITTRVLSLFMVWLAIALCSTIGVFGQHGGSGALGGSTASAGAVMKLPAKKVVHTTTTTKPRPGTRSQPQPVNSGQLEDALSLADDARQAGRNESAERGYLLAAKLAPSDPRPYLGLA